MSLVIAPYDESFLHASIHWFRDPEFRAAIRAAEVDGSEQREWFHGLPYRTDYVIRGILRNGRPVGALGLRDIVGKTAEWFHFFADPAERSVDNDHWALRSALAFASERGLVELRIRLVATDERLDIVRDLGFTVTDAGDGVSLASFALASSPAADTSRPTVDACRIIDLPRIADPRGNLTFIEAERHVPFAVRRVYYLYDVPGGTARAGHAHRGLQQFLIALSGSLDVSVHDGRQRRTFHLNRSYYGLFVPNMIWRDIDNFSSNSVCLSLADQYYDEADYIRDFVEFESIVGTA